MASNFDLMNFILPALLRGFNPIPTEGGSNDPYSTYDAAKPPSFGSSLTQGLNAGLQGMLGVKGDATLPENLITQILSGLISQGVGKLGGSKYPTQQKQKSIPGWGEFAPQQKQGGDAMGDIMKIVAMIAML